MTQFAERLRCPSPDDNRANRQRLYRAIMANVLLGARQSPDPSTQNCAVLCNDSLSMVTPIIQTYALNEFPRGVEYSDERWERPLKYDIVGHAEENAVLAAARSGIATEGLTMIAAWAACANCARIIIQAGIHRLVTLRPTTAHGKWGASIDIAMTMLEEAAVEVIYLDGPFGVTVRRNGEDVEF